jgi:hypothetical protein
MSSSLSITKELTNSGWVITAAVLPGGTLPLEIFVYENTGTSELGDYVGVISVDNIPRLQIWNNTPIPAFGNKFVRHNVGVLIVTSGSDPDAVITVLKNSVQDLSTKLQAEQSSTQVFTII